MKIVVVTAMTANKSNLEDPQYTEGIDEFICFTDDHDLKSNVWQIKKANLFYYPHRSSRYHKIPIQASVECDISIWVDANLTLLKSPIHAVELLEDHEMGACLHWLPSWYIGALEVLNRDNPNTIYQQIERYDRLGLPREAPLFAGGFLVRKHTNKVGRFNWWWWYEVLNYSKRDQISMAFAAHQVGLEIKNLGNFYGQPFFAVRNHNYVSFPA